MLELRPDEQSEEPMRGRSQKQKPNMEEMETRRTQEDDKVLDKAAEKSPQEEQ